MSTSNFSEPSRTERDHSRLNIFQLSLLLANSWKTIVFVAFGVIAVTISYIYMSPKLYSVSASVTALQNEPNINVTVPAALRKTSRFKSLTIPIRDASESQLSSKSGSGILFSLSAQQLQTMLADTISSNELVTQFLENKNLKSKYESYIQDIDVNVSTGGVNAVFYTKTESLESELLQDYIKFSVEELHKKVERQKTTVLEQHLERLEAERTAVLYLHKLQLEASLQQLKRAKILASELGIHEPSADIAGFARSTEQIVSQEVGEVIALYGLGERHLERFVESLSTSNYVTDELLILKAQEVYLQNHKKQKTPKLYMAGHLDNTQVQVKPRTFLLILMSTILGLLLGMIVAIVKNRSDFQ